MLPLTWKAPPMITTPRTRPAMSGACCRASARLVDDQLRGRARVGGYVQLRRHRVVAQAVVAVDVHRPRFRSGFRLQRACRAARDRGGKAPGLLQVQRIVRGRFDRGVAEGGGDADQVDLRVLVQVQQGQGVVDARVGIENDFQHVVVLLLPCGARGAGGHGAGRRALHCPIFMTGRANAGAGRHNAASPGTEPPHADPRPSAGPAGAGPESGRHGAHRPARRPVGRRPHGAAAAGLAAAAGRRDPVHGGGHRRWLGQPGR
ncbi:hypothetical protein G6F22_015533 [Rhizopus arrhizus]|nr:hypothetical protein G6F22_015533 [Rhizopus arrhizus]